MMFAVNVLGFSLHRVLYVCHITYKHPNGGSIRRMEDNPSLIGNLYDVCCAESSLSTDECLVELMIMLII
jgi:hypothetical protein